MDSALVTPSLPTSALLTDVYELNMLQAYLARDHVQPAAFEFFVRKLASCRGCLIAAGLEQVLAFLEEMRFTAEGWEPL